MKRKAGRGRAKAPARRGAACGRRASAGAGRRTGLAPLGASVNDARTKGNKTMLIKHST